MTSESYRVRPKQNTTVNIAKFKKNTVLKLELDLPHLPDAMTLDGLELHQSEERRLGKFGGNIHLSLSRLDAPDLYWQAVIIKSRLVVIRELPV